MTANKDKTPIQSKVEELLNTVKKFVLKHKKILSISAFFLVMAVVITVITVKLAASDKENQEVLESIVLDETVADAEVLATFTQEIPVPQDPLLENAYETVNDLVNKW